jgi:HTH-type transcriptional regulator/antitoxin HigA
MGTYSAGNLLQEILTSRNLTQTWLAIAMSRPPQVVSEIVTGKKSITVATAIDLERALTIPAEVWLATQTACNLRDKRGMEKA